MCWMMKRENIPNTSENTSSSCNLETVRQFWMRFFSPVSILVNLEPKPLKGIESQGMILMAENADGTLSFVAPEKELKPGSEIR